jgi:predicted nuclease of predicted toxin-antitoxin system
MLIWIDAQISPAIAAWINTNFPSLTAQSVRSQGLVNSDDEEIFLKARQANAIVLTKDIDFTYLLDRFGPPPKIILLGCGNTSNERVRQIFKRHLMETLSLLETGENLIEIID